MTRSRLLPRLLIVKQLLVPMGGACGVTIRAIEALRGEYDITVATLNPLDLDALNLYYGSSFLPGDFRHLRMPAPARFAQRMLGVGSARFTHLQHAVLCRWLRSVANDYDLILSFDNEIDAGRFAAQYVHVPHGPVPPPPEQRGRIHRLPGVLRTYYAVADAIAPIADAAIARNLTFVNSEWTGRRFRERYGGAPVTLYPPVQEIEPGLPWDSRAARFVCTGRIAREKRQDVAIEIVERLRDRGHDLTLAIIATEDDAGDYRVVDGLAAARPWVTIHRSIPRQEVLRILSTSRYGIHAMIDEHFGMAVSEMTAAGCIPFVHASGGPKEIVADHRLTWRTVDEAVARIEAVLGDATLQSELRSALARRARAFSFETFRDTLRHHVAAALALS